MMEEPQTPGSRGPAGGISRRVAIAGAVAIAVLSSAVTYAVTAGVRPPLGDWAGPRARAETMRELYRSEGFQRFLSVLTLIREHYVEEPDMEKVMMGAARGAVDALGDPYSAFFSAKEFEHFHEETGGTYGGIGVQVIDEGRYVVVVRAFPGTPGATTPFEGAGPDDPKGLQPKDKIVKVQDRDVVGLPEDKVAEMIRGPAGTTVTITVLRSQDGGGERQLVFRVRRDRIRVPTTEARMLTPSVGYLQITQFLDGTARQVRKDLQWLRQQGARAIVLDLRHNPGGRLDVSVEVARSFIPRGPVVHVVDRSGKRETYVSDNPRGLGMPLVVLIDEATASASEILAGAIQDRRVGIVVGTPSFGKGLVQQVFDLDDGTGLKLTVMKYLTPRGRDINRRPADPEKEGEGGGIRPDIRVDRPAGFRLGVVDPERDPQLRKALEVLERRLAGADRAAGR